MTFGPAGPPRRLDFDGRGIFVAKVAQNPL
jgi:hypothetical protein